MRFVLLLMLSTFVLAPMAAWSSAYTWVDADGGVHFADTPPEAGGAKLLRFEEPCVLKEEVQERERLQAVVILGTFLGGLDDSNARLAKKRLSDKYHALALPLHDLEEFCTGGDQEACACLSSITNRRKPRGFRRSLSNRPTNR